MNVLYFQGYANRKDGRGGTLPSSRTRIVEGGKNVRMWTWLGRADTDEDTLINDVVVAWTCGHRRGHDDQ